MEKPRVCEYKDCKAAVGDDTKRWSSDRRRKPYDGGKPFDEKEDWDICDDCGGEYCGRHTKMWSRFHTGLPYFFMMEEHCLCLECYGKNKARSESNQ
jgi:hypothetical protein